MDSPTTARISIDAGRCTRCGRCFEVCGINFLKGPDGSPTPAASPGSCFACGHCRAACPADAIAHDGLGGLRFSPAGGTSADPYGTLMGLLTLRRSRREFRDEPLSRELIDKLLLAAAQAPNAINRRNVHYTVVTDKDALRGMSRRASEQVVKLTKLLGNPLGRLVFRVFFRRAAKELEPLFPLLGFFAKAAETGKDAILYGAPCAILVHTPVSDGAGGAEDACYAASNILLAAEALGLGACVIGFITGPIEKDKELRRLARLSDDRKVQTTVIVGRPRFPYAKALTRPAPPTTLV